MGRNNNNNDRDSNKTLSLLKDNSKKAIFNLKPKSH